MKKLLSLVLALSLIISVAPMAFAINKSEAAPTVDSDFSAIPGMYFNFSASNWGDMTEDIAKETIVEKDTAKEFATTNTDPWRVAGQYCIADYRITSEKPDTINYPKSKANALYWSITDSSYSIYSTSNGRPTGILAIGVYLDEVGVFTPSISYEAGTTSCVHTLFIGPRDLFTARSAGYGFDSTSKNIYLQNQSPMVNALLDSARNPRLIKIGTENLYSDTETPEREEAVFDPIVIQEPGFYYLYIVPSRVTKTVPTIAPYYMNLYSIDFEPTPAEELTDMAVTATKDTGYDSATAPTTATVKTLALYGDTSDTIETESVTYGSTATINEAPATVTREDGTYNFLYWAKGLEEGASKQILSTSNESFSYKPHEGANYLIAVYEKEGTEKAAAFYNYNGQLLTDLTITDNKLPALPAMAGLGDAIGWEQLGTGEVFEEGADISNLEGDKVFMAKYAEPTADITINGIKYSYGEKIVCKDLANTGFDAGTFSYWTKTVDNKVQIVSFDSDYTFNAWENCTVKAHGNVELSGTARKILLSTFSVGENLTAVMAEFIGFEGAKEKGIMFGEKKIAMTSDYAQFTVTNDTADAVTVTGYAVVDESGETVKYTDGEISVAGVAAE